MPNEIVEDVTIGLDDVEPNTTYVNCEVGYANHNSDISDVVFDHCTFKQHNFSNGAWVDSVIKNCDFTNADFTRSYWLRCQLQDVKLMGANFGDSAIKKLTLTNCVADYCNFSDSKLTDFSATGDRFIESYWNNVTFAEQAVFAECNLTDADFMDSKLKGVDLSTSQVAGIRLNLQLARGLKVSTFQAADILAGVGVEVI